MLSITMQITNHTATTGPTKRSHLPNGIPAVASTAISTPEVGLMQFTMPSPSSTVCTIT